MFLVVWCVWLFGLWFFSCLADNLQTTQAAKHICSYIIASLAEKIENVARHKVEKNSTRQLSNYSGSKA